MQPRSHTPARPGVGTLVGVAFIALVLFGLSDPVSAKGPESATISGPGIDHPIELVDTADHSLLVKLMEQTGLWYGTGDLPRPIERPVGELGPSYTLTWVNGGPPGMSKEDRTIYQLLYLDAEYGPVIHTPAQKLLENWGPGVIGWFAAPKGLWNTLAKLGVPISEAMSNNDGPLSDRATNVAPSDREPLDTFRTLGVAAFALLFGLAGALFVRRMVRSIQNLPPAG